MLISGLKHHANQLVHLGKKKKGIGLSKILSITAILISIIALVASIKKENRDFNYNKEHDTKIIKPYVSVKVEVNSFDNTYNILIRNDGLGLAKIKRVKYHYDEKYYKDILDVFLAKFNIDNREDYNMMCVGDNLNEDCYHVIRKGAYMSILKIEGFYNFDSIKFLQILQEMMIEVVYTDIHDYEYTDKLIVIKDYS